MGPVIGQPGAFWREIFSIDAEGLLAERDVHELDNEGDLVAEIRFAADGRWLEHTQYRTVDSELMIRQLDMEGQPISEWE